ncbi:MAG: hypothetical protein Q4D32_03730 [Eubacteriales bacterium]|nr:hypothetical protein [Eubacteriales bacterium]
MNTETTWSNIRNLTKILLMQHRIHIYSIVGIITWISAWNVCSSTIAMAADDAIPWCIYSSNSSMMVLIIAGIALVFGSYNILSRDEISMFPGTVMSRYYSTILTYHIMIMILVLTSIWSYLIQGVSLLVVSHINKEIIPGSLFNIHYLCYGVVRYLALLLAIHGISTLWCTLLERFRPIIIYAIGVICVGAVIVLMYTGYIGGVVRELVYLYNGEKYSLGMLVTVFLLIWVVCMLLSWWLAKSVKAWGKSDRKRAVISFVFLYGFLMTSIFGVMFGHDGYDYTVDLAEFEQLTDHHIETTVDVSALPEEERSNLGDYMMRWLYINDADDKAFSTEDVFASVVCTASQAKEYGLSFDESKLDQDHIILLLGSQSLTYDGKDLGEDILNACKDSVALVQDTYDGEDQEVDPEGEIDSDYYYQVEIPTRTLIVLNESYGDQKAFMKNTTLGRYEHYNTRYSGTESLLRVVICPDEWGIDLNNAEEMEE